MAEDRGPNVLWREFEDPKAEAVMLHEGDGLAESGGNLIVAAVEVDGGVVVDAPDAAGLRGEAVALTEQSSPQLVKPGAAHLQMRSGGGGVERARVEVVEDAADKAEGMAVDQLLVFIAGTFPTPAPCCSPPLFRLRPVLNRPRHDFPRSLKMGVRDGGSRTSRVSDAPRPTCPRLPANGFLPIGELRKGRGGEKKKRAWG